MLKLGLETILAPKVPPGERMVIKHTCNQSPIVSENGNVPSQECNFAVIENLHLFLVPVFLVDVLDASSQLFHRVFRVLENIFEKSTVINCVVFTFLTAFTEGFPHDLFFFLYLLF